MVLIHGQMEHNIKENIVKVKNKEKVNLFGINQFIKEILKMTIFMDLENIFGQMAMYFKELCLIIKCTGKEFIIDQMEENIKENISKIKNKDLAYFIGEMGKNIKDCGIMEKNMD